MKTLNLDCYQSAEDENLSKEERLRLIAERILDDLSPREKWTLEETKKYAKTNLLISQAILETMRDYKRDYKQLPVKISKIKKE